MKPRKTKYHKTPMKFDIALRKYVPDLDKLEELKEKINKIKKG